MSPRGRAATELPNQQRLATVIYQTRTADASHAQHDFSLFHVQSGQAPNPKFLFPLTPVRLKDYSLLSSNDPQVSSNDLTFHYQAPYCQSQCPFQGEEITIENQWIRNT